MLDMDLLSNVFFHQINTRYQEKNGQSETSVHKFYGTKVFSCSIKVWSRTL